LGGDLSGNNNSVTITAINKVNISAYFISLYSISVTTEPEDSADISFNPPGPIYDKWTVVNIKATPRENYRFDYWIGDLNVKLNPATITMDFDKLVTAHLVKLSKLDTEVIPENGGSISINPPGGIYDEDTDVPVIAIPALGYRFDHWGGDIDSKDNPAIVKMTKAEMNVTAYFVNVYSLITNMEPSDGGSVIITPPGGVYDEGSIIEMTAISAPGYRFNHWSGDIIGENEYTTITMNADKNAKAHFVKVYSINTNVEPSYSGNVSTNPAGRIHDKGTEVVVIANTSPGFRFEHWNEDAYSKNPIIANMDSDKSFTAHFKRIYTLNVTIDSSNGGNIIMDPAGGIYDEGTIVNVRIASKEGYRFHHWSRDAIGSENIVSVTMTRDKNIVANMVRTYNLVTNVEPNGSGAVLVDQLDGPYSDNMVVNANANPADGYRFDYWSGDASGSENPVSINMNKDKTITAHFIRTYSLTTNVDPNGGGVVVIDPIKGIYDSDEKIRLTAIQVDGYRFSHWGGDVSGSESSITITMNSNKNVTAYFVRRYTLTVNADPSNGGIMILDPEGGIYDEGTTVKITAAINEGYRFDKWTGDASGNESSINITIDRDKNIIGNFIRTYALDVIVDPIGSGNVSANPPGGTYDQGAVVKLTTTPAEGYRFSHWSGDANGSDNPLSVTMDRNKIIKAHFIGKYILTVNVFPLDSGSANPPSGVYDSEASLILTATPINGYRFDCWSGYASGKASSINITMDSNKSVTANFIRIYNLDTSVEPLDAGSVEPLDGLFDSGLLLKLTATPSEGYRFDCWGGSASGTDNPLNITMNGDKNVIAHFVEVYNLTTSIEPVGGGTIDPPEGVYDLGSPVTVTATPSEGYHFDHWGGDADGSNNPLNINMDGNKNIVAHFALDYVEPVYYELTVNVAPEQGGNVSPSGGIYASGEIVQLTVTPAAGYDFVNWTGALTGNTNPESITMDGAKTVTANFVKKTYALTVNISPIGGGSVALNPSGGTYEHGTVVQLTATPAAGYDFVNWTSDLTGNINPESITMDGAKTVTANFVNTYTLATNANPLAGGSVTPGNTYDTGTEVTITATVNPGYRFDSWSGDTTGATYPTATSIKVTMDSNRSITANFVKQYTLTLGIAGIYNEVIDAGNVSITLAPAPPGNDAASSTLSDLPGTYDYDEGTIVTLTADLSLGQQTGWWFSQWLEDPQTGNVYIVTMDANKTATALYSYDPIMAPTKDLVSIRLCDLDKSGRIDVTDLVLIGNYLGKSANTINKQELDINNDGKIDIQDVVMIGKRFGTIYSPNAPSDDIWNIDEKYLLVLVKIYNYMNYNSSDVPEFIDVKELIRKLISSIKVTQTKVYNNFPNPFNPGTWIPYQLAKDSDVIIRIYDIKGRLVKTMELGYRKAGAYLARDVSAYWDGRNEAGDQVSSGIYFYSFQAGSFNVIRKMIVVR
jgi:uncharacterized repeat protein (TIGR02543 family)